MQTNILAETNHRLISDLDMAYLPSKCKAHHNFCYSQTGTFIWSTKDHNKKCDFEFYRSAQFIRVQPYTFMDETNKLIIQFDNKGAGAVVNCNGQAVMQTISGLWVTARNANKPWIWSKLTTPNIHQAFETSYNYLIYTFT